MGFVAAIWTAVFVKSSSAWVFGTGVRRRSRNFPEACAGEPNWPRVFLHHPDLLLLDEPSTGLDPNARREVWTYLESVRRSEGTTMVLTTHLMEEAEKCDRIGILDGGKLIAIGPPDQLKAAIGGDVITATSDKPGELQSQIRERFGVKALLVDDTLRIEKEQGHEFITKLVEAFPGRIQSIRLGKPTLEDVFVHHTGHRFTFANGAVEEAKK